MSLHFIYYILVEHYNALFSVVIFVGEHWETAVCPTYIALLTGTDWSLLGKHGPTFTKEQEAPAKDVCIFLQQLSLSHIQLGWQCRNVPPTLSLDNLASHCYILFSVPAEERRKNNFWHDNNYVPLLPLPVRKLEYSTFTFILLEIFQKS